MRIPVAASLRVAGTTPYYGANGIQDYVEGYTHDGEFILVAEDGANDLKNYPVKCVKGRIWVNNHAHVLQGKCACADNQFLAYAISQADIESLLVGGGRAKLNAETLMDIELLLPSKDEQIQIGSYLTQLDCLITLHQRKYDKLTNVKKSMLEKMFPKNGSNVPEIRFKGFTEAWEQRKLGEVVGITSGFMGDSLLSDGKYHLTRIETIADGMVDENRIGYSNKKPDDMYLLNHGDILYSNINSISHMGKVAKYQGNSTLYHGINLLRLQPENNIDPDFLLYLLNTEKCRNWAKTRANQAVSQASINQSLLATQEIAISSFEEQEKIGEYFRNLDRLITLHQRELEKLQNIKKSMLEKMFV